MEVVRRSSSREPVRVESVSAPHDIGGELPKNPENLEAPNKSELKPKIRPDVSKDLGKTAIKGTQDGKK